jgi:hypothetical protein
VPIVLASKQGLGPLMRCCSELTDAEVFGSGKDDWIPVPKEPQTDQFGGVRVPEAKAK